MYAKVNFTVDKRENTLVVPANAVVDLGGKRGVFLPAEGNLATFRAIEQGVTTTELVEVASGLSEGEKIITTGAGALREGDRIVLPGQTPQNAGGPGGNGRGGRRGGPGSGGERGGAPGAARRSAAATAAAGPRRRAGSAEHRRLSDDDDERPGATMSIPRFAIERPVMMTMISSIIMLIGGISLTRLPVDLLPDISQPTITVRVNYTGVGPLEIEELITRPLEQQLSAVSGLEQMNSSSNEGNSQVRLNFTWGHDLNEAMDEIRTRIDRVRGRLPEDADPPQIQKFDSNSAPIMGLGVESSDGTLDRVELRELAEHVLSPRLERTPGVAAVTVNGGLRRQIHVELSREKITALDLSVDRVVNVLRTENQNMPIGEIYQGDRAYLLRSQGQFETLRADRQHRRDDAHRRAGLPQGHRRGEGHDRGQPVDPAHQRARGRPDAGHQAVGHQHGADRRGRARRARADQP